MNKIIFRQMLPIRTLLHFLFRHYDSNPATFWMYRIQTYEKRIPSFCRLGPKFCLFKYISGCDPKNLGMPWACIISAVCCILSSSKFFLACERQRTKSKIPNKPNNLRAERCAKGNWTAHRALSFPVHFWAVTWAVNWWVHMLKHSLILQPSYWPNGTINNSLKPEQQYFFTQCSQIATRAKFFGRFQDFARLYFINPCFEGKRRMDQLWSGSDRGKLKIIRWKLCPNTILSFTIPTWRSPGSNRRSCGDRPANSHLLKA